MTPQGTSPTIALLCDVCGREDTIGPALAPERPWFIPTPNVKRVDGLTVGLCPDCDTEQTRQDLKDWIAEVKLAERLARWGDIR